MRKKHEQSNKKSCFNRAKPNEWIFTLMGRDVCSPKTIRYWCKQRIKEGKNKKGDAQIEEALMCARNMEQDLRMKNLRKIERSNKPMRKAA